MARFLIYSLACLIATISHSSCRALGPRPPRPDTSWRPGAPAGSSRSCCRPAQLLVSELVTNALRHGHGRIVLRARLDGDRLRVEVIDEGSGFERELRRTDFQRVGGRGLEIIEHAASSWACTRAPPMCASSWSDPGPGSERERPSFTERARLHPFDRVLRLSPPNAPITPDALTPDSHAGT